MPLGTVPENVSAEAIAFAKQTFKHPNVDSWREADKEFAEIYDKVMAGIVSNVKTQPGGFLATSGVVLPYYLNLSTNFMDPEVAPLLVDLFSRVLCKIYDELGLPAGEKVAIVGPEVAGGMLVSQLSAAGNAELNKRFDYVYMRKAKKSTGTAQQLEAMKAYTSRTPESAARKCIWIDDVNSTGSSLCEGIVTLLQDYNLDVAVAFYVVDRAADRQNLEQPRQRLSDERFVSGATVIRAIMDLSEVDLKVPKDHMKQ